ncbi:hypothetical protein [Paenibacillus gansuensis]|uniref:Uncharacterized protein n=1 Tax=Paenibacillus gansuensis TaxID=306542 RepID=A0ABW5PL25_9BACL
MIDRFTNKLLQIETECLNPQDAILIRLFLEGVEIHEVIYLKKNSLNPMTGMLTVTDATGRKRCLQVSRKCVELYQRAVQQAFYVFETKTLIVPLMDSAYLIKASVTDYTAHERMLDQMDTVILRTVDERLRNLAEIYNCPDLTYLPTGITAGC